MKKLKSKLYVSFRISLYNGLFLISDAICSPPRIRTNSSIWKGSGYIQPGTEEKVILPGGSLGSGNENALFWPFFGAKSGRHRQRSSHRHLRTRWLKNVTCMPDLSAISMTIHTGKKNFFLIRTNTVKLGIKELLN